MTTMSRAEDTGYGPATTTRLPGTRGRLLILCGVAALAAACAGAEAEKAATPPPPAPVVIGSENVVTVAEGTVVVGPIVSGELRPQREATVRAELGGAMLQVTVEEGQSVRRGQLLGRIETRTLEAARQSAASAVRSAENAMAVAQREAERSEKLVAAGALAARDLEVARNTVASSEALVADARSRLASAERELADAVINAPISGIVSRKAVNTGDVVSVGTELFTIIDPSSLRLEASVPSDDLRLLQRGAMVDFRVRGYDQPLEGEIERIAPEADATTRQVPIFVAVPNTGGRLVAGLFAEGRVVSESAEGLVVPINAVNTTGAKPWVLRVTDGRTERVEVTLGLVDRQTERVQIASGVAAGDVLLRGASQGISPGTRVQVNLK
jgi:membrane fusion protein (multidrug efflux system)